MEISVPYGLLMMFIDVAYIERRAEGSGVNFKKNFVFNLNLLIKCNDLDSLIKYL